MSTSPFYCPVCGDKTKFKYWLYDDRYGYCGTYALHICKTCGHQALNIAMSDEEIKKLYTDYYPRSSFDPQEWSPAKYERGVRAWLEGVKASAYCWVPKQIRILDIGCGFGESLGYHLARGCDAHGIEADANVTALSKLYGLKIKVGLFRSEEYDSNSFDYVTLNQVVEHLIDPISLLKEIRVILKPGGTLVISTPNVEGWGPRIFRRKWIHWHAPYHLQFFSSRSMELAAASSGFIIDRRTTVTSSAWIGFQWKHLAMFPAQGQASRFWSKKIKRNRLMTIVLRMLRVIDYSGLNIFLTRFFDIFGQGDNVVYVLRRSS